MAGDLIREVRRAVLTHAKADAALTALVPAASHYPSTTPAAVAWPFTRFDAPQSLPIDGGCYAGAEVSFLWHAFAKPRYQNATMIETAEDHAARIGSAMKEAVHRRRIPLGAVTALVKVRSIRLIRDGDEADAYHAILSCGARVVAV